MDRFLGIKRKAAAPPPVVQKLAVSMTIGRCKGIGRHAWIVLQTDGCPEVLTDAYHHAYHAKF